MCEKTILFLSIVLISIQAFAQDIDKMDDTTTYRQPAMFVTPDQQSGAGSMLYSGDYNKSNWEFGIGYVNKSWVCTYQSGTQREDFFGDPSTKFFHGFQFGGLYTPSFDWGLGLRTGAFLEVYISRNSLIRQFCDHFDELDLYIPLHVSYRIPVQMILRSIFLVEPHSSGQYLVSTISW